MALEAAWLAAGGPESHRQNLRALSFIVLSRKNAASNTKWDIRILYYKEACCRPGEPVELSSPSSDSQSAFLSPGPSSHSPAPVGTWVPQEVLRGTKALRWFNNTVQ